jgi:hypothetical protein
MRSSKYGIEVAIHDARAAGRRSVSIAKRRRKNGVTVAMGRRVMAEPAEQALRYTCSACGAPELIVTFHTPLAAYSQCQRCGHFWPKDAETAYLTPKADRRRQSDQV